MDPGPGNQGCGTLAGDVVVQTPADVEPLQRVCVIEGNLTVVQAGVDFSLRRLVRVDGSVSIRDTELRAIELPRLASIGGSLFITEHSGFSGKLQVLELPALQRVESDVRIHGELSLREIHLPALELVGGSLRVSADTITGEASALLRLRLPALQRVLGDLSVTANAALDTLDLSALQVVGVDLAIGQLVTGLEGEEWPEPNPSLRSIELPQLSQVGRMFDVHLGERLTSIDLPVLQEVGQLNLEHNPVLTELALPALERCAGFVRVVDNPALELLGLPSLRSCGLEIEDNPMLSTLALPALEESLEIHMHGNALDVLALPSLERIEDVFYQFDGIDEVQLPKLTNVGITLLLRGATAFDLPALDAAGGLVVSDDVLGVSAPVLRTVERLEVYRSALTALELPALDTVGGIVSIYENPALATLQLPLLATIGTTPPVWDATQNWLELADNPVLATLELPALESIAGACTIVGSPSLTSCELSDAVFGGTLDVPLVCQ